jgi:hypothetical protein
MQAIVHVPNMKTGKALCGGSDGITASIDKRSVTGVDANDEDITCVECRGIMEGNERKFPADRLTRPFQFRSDPLAAAEP